MDEYKKYLADRLLSEEQPVSYRLLSRALDLHVNTAKEMLYDFHVYQNEQKANSVHATYLVYGRKAVESQKGPDGDVEMSSSMPGQNDDDEPEVPTFTMGLVREENLTESLKAFQEVLSIHVYSLSPHPQRDLALLADLTRSVAEYTVKEEEPSVSAKKYGSIINPHVRRRTRKGPAPVAAPPKAQPVAAKPKAETPFAKASVEPKEKASNPGSVASKIKKEGDDASKESTPAPSSKPTPSLQRGGSGGIMQSFAKAANMPKKPKKEEDTAMALSDDGEADDDDIPAPKKVKEEDESLRKTKKEREEALRKMMEDDDDDDDDDEPEEKDDPADQEMEEAPEPVPELETKVEAKEEPSEVISSAEGGRRRGRRKVMQKKRILDDQGYMVTVNEPGWESFSEDEAPPPKKAAPSSSKDSSTAKAKKPAGKAGQGNIMSFFSKK